MVPVAIAMEIKINFLHLNFKANILSIKLLDTGQPTDFIYLMGELLNDCNSEVFTVITILHSSMLPQHTQVLNINHYNFEY